jgi:hypothetical protein
MMNKITPPKKHWQMKVFPLFTLLGWTLIVVSLIIGTFVVASTAANYWGSNAKTVRDAAETGSFLIGQLQTLATIPRWLEPLTFLGVAAFMVGIALEFSSIPAALKTRAVVMRANFPLIVKLNQKQK